MEIQSTSFRNDFPLFLYFLEGELPVEKMGVLS